MRRKRGNPFKKVVLFCLVILLSIGILNVSYALWSQTLYIQGTVTTGQWDDGGTIGFWKNWDSHNTYTEVEIEGWLAGLGSGWFSPATVEDMEAIIDAALDPGSNTHKMFRAQYLATRLDSASGRLNPTTVHDFSGYDPGNYLGLGGSGTVPEIIGAIEGKVGPPWPNNSQYELMKDVCDALNNLWI